MIDKTDKKRLLADFKALLELDRPNIERTIFHKVEEVKNIVSSYIDQYTDNEGRGETLNRHTSPQKNDSSKVIAFEIYKIGTMWIPILPEMMDINQYSVLPLPLIDYIVESAEGGIIGFKKLVQVKNHHPIIISFQKDSGGVIKGTIEKVENLKTSIDNQVELIEPKSTKQDDLQTFLEYLLSPENDAFTAYMIRDFFIRWKPLLDAGCIEFPRQINAV